MDEILATVCFQAVFATLATVIVNYLQAIISSHWTFKAMVIQKGLFMKLQCRPSHRHHLLHFVQTFLYLFAFFK